MKSLRRVASLLMVMGLAIAGLVVSSGPASAAVVVPPGQAGHTCSEYKYADSTKTRYWQTCAWADYRYVWFTVNFGNSSPYSWEPYLTTEDYIKAGVPKTCLDGYQYYFAIASHTTRGTDRMDCILTRVPGAYASIGKVQYTSDQAAVEQHSPTLQVQ